MSAKLIDNATVLRILAYITVLFGVAVGISLRKSHRRGATGFGLTLVAAGSVFAVESYYAFSTLFWLASQVILAVAGVTFAYFAVGKQKRIFLLLGGLLFPLLQSEIAGLSWVVLVVYSALCLSLANAFDYSRIRLTPCREKTNRYLAIFLWPLAGFERFCLAIGKGSVHRWILIGGYSVVQLMILLVIPFSISVLSGQLFQFEDLVVALMALLILSGRECRKMLRYPGMPTSSSLQNIQR